jgi:uncharacterized damage-inducible protein DinB
MSLSERKRVLNDHLSETRGQLFQVIAQLQPGDWAKAVQSTEGDWTAKQALLHIADAESGQIRIGRAIAAGEPTVPDDFDPNRYNNRQVEKNRDRELTDILAGMKRSREELLAFLAEVPDDALDKRGRHPRGDVLSLEELFYRVGEHEADHCVEIRRAVE